MVSKKRLDDGFNCFRAPIIPRAPRSVRRRSPRKILEEDEKLCAFELLATVAGKLLEESEGSASSNVVEGSVHCQDGNEKELHKDDKSLKSESFDRGSCAESAFVPEVSIKGHNLLSNFKGLLEADDHPSVHINSDSAKKLDSGINLGVCQEKSSKRKDVSSEGGRSCVGECLNFKVEDGSEVQSEDEKNKIGDLSMANISTVKDPIGVYVNTNLLVNSESSVKLPMYRDPIPGALLRKHRDDVKLGIRDDDENYFGCNKHSPKIRPFRPRPHIGQRRMRKMITSKYWKAVPKLKDWELYNTSEGMKAFYRYRKGIYARERCQQVPLKKRKLSNHRFAVGYDWNTSSDSIYNMPEKADGASAKVRAHTKPRDHHVTVSIKSFKVPELYLEVPESATVGSLKRTVLEAVTTILGGGIRVGVVFQGKKVRDDNRTLQQAGIAHCSNVDNLGFTLEPSSTHIPSPVTPKKLPVSSMSDADQNIPTSPPTPAIGDSEISNASANPPLGAKLDNVDNKEVIPSPNAKAPDNMLIDGAGPEAMALVPVSPMEVDALAAVPVNQKPSHPELSQRRTRRPFSVAEVEALVEAVEKLGTGRWRDVKMRAFEDADHRTYVDLKDKWKTLVHTASISPQQRRGEPVPHELLNRVLSAHSCWSQHQSKQQQGKPQPVEPLQFADFREEVVVAQSIKVNPSHS